MVSATRDRPYPGDAPASWPGMWSVNTNTSASRGFSTLRAPSTILLLAAGATRMLYAMPLTRFTMPAPRRAVFPCTGSTLSPIPLPANGMHSNPAVLPRARCRARTGKARMQ